MDTDILTMAALVAAYVGVAKLLGMPPKYSSLLALGVAAVIVLVPEGVQEKIVLISTIGLTATGAYEYAKNIKSDKGGGNTP